MPEELRHAGSADCRMCGLRNAGSAERRKNAGGPEERRAEKIQEKNRKNAGTVADSQRVSETQSDIE